MHSFYPHPITLDYHLLPRFPPNFLQHLFLVVPTTTVALIILVYTAMMLSSGMVKEQNNKAHSSIVISLTVPIVEEANWFYLRLNHGHTRYGS